MHCILCTKDFGAHGIAPKVVSARDKFSQGKEESGMVKKRSQPETSVIPGGPPLENLIVPSKSTIGAWLLKAMGWREGEGVGPRILKYHTQVGVFTLFQEFALVVQEY